uniref:2-oxoglutarate-dependent dioxygenase DAO n=1 Tax=Rhizophora mucronata TaxID=61149 RepID=A0A2P2IIT3_RHIMU
MLEGMKALFDLPEDTKNKYVSPKPYRSYSGKCSIVPLHESFGIDDPHCLDAAQAFTNLLWPQGNPGFCETLRAMSSKMIELNFLLLKMIFESFGMESHYNSQFEDSTSLLRIMKYKVPPGGSSSDSAIGLVAHTDKNALTILCQNGVQGLEVQTKEGDWVQVVIPQDAFFVVVGDALKAWSNGRLHAARHRVMISGDKERYSCALFLIPKEGATIEVPDKLVDKEHPLLYRPFSFADYISYFVSKLSHDALETYAGI